MPRHQFGLMELSAVQELTNVGLGHAATALSALTGQQLTITVPSADEMEVEAIPELVGGPEAPTVAIAMEIEGDLAGILAFVMAEPDAKDMAKAVLETYGTPAEDYDRMEKSLFIEVGNIIDSNFLTAISNMTESNTMAGVPILLEDMAASVVSSLLASALETGDQALIFQTKVQGEKSSMRGFFLYIPAASTLRFVFDSLGIPEAA